MKYGLLLILVFVVVIGGYAQVQLVNPPTVAAPRGYSHAAIVDLGTCRMVIISGQVALDVQGNLVGKDDMEKQTRQVFQNIEAVVTDAGGTMDNIVKLGYFTTDVSKIGVVRTVRDEFINTQHPPASTLVQVSRLFREDILIEVEATAVIPKR
ncbi:MAG: RidA family protein [Bacteroidetes bacterium]|nr:RidA family protein [Bacteroidota bacterium]